MLFVHIPVGNLTNRISEVEEEKNKEVVRVCLSDGRAHTGIQTFIQVVFDHIVNLENKMLHGNKPGYSVER